MRYQNTVSVIEQHRESDGNAYTVRRGQRFDRDDDDKLKSKDFDVSDGDGDNDDNVDDAYVNFIFCCKE